MRLSLFFAVALFGFVMSKASAAAPSEDTQLAPLQSMLQTPESQIDLAKAKLIIDRIIDPKVDAPATLRELDILAARIKARFPANANSQTKLEFLVTSLAQPGPWNDYRAFSYDLTDPFGKVIRNKLISTYLQTRKGNCVSMPVLLVILGQKVGVNLTLATAPEHVLAKFRNDQGQWINIEATSFGVKPDAGYQKELGISPKAMATGIYLRPRSKRESVAIMMSTLMEFYGRQDQQERRIAVADMALVVDSKDVDAMLQKGNAYFRMVQQRYVSRHPSQAHIPQAQKQDFAKLARNNELWFERAEALGWTEPTQAQKTNYLQTIQRAKAAQGVR